MAGITNLTVKDSGSLKALRELKMTLTCGLHEEQAGAPHQGGPLTVVEVAEINEFGSAAARIPARPWLRGWADNAPAKKIVTQIRAALVNMVKTQNFAPEPMQAVTVATLTSMASQFLDGKMQPNAPLTLAKKAPEKRPLIETQQLVQALRARLVAALPGWNFEADSPTVSGPKFRAPKKYGPKKPKQFGPKLPQQFGPKRPQWLQAKGP
jgi:hypothetical protein